MTKARQLCAPDHSNLKGCQTVAGVEPSDTPGSRKKTTGTQKGCQRCMVPDALRLKPHGSMAMLHG